MKSTLLQSTLLSLCLVASSSLFTSCSNDTSNDTKQPSTATTDQAPTADQSSATPEDKTTNLRPPKYLSVKGFKACTGSKDMGGWTSLCLPNAKPTDCSDDAWKQLGQLKELSRCDEPVASDEASTKNDTSATQATSTEPSPTDQ